MLLVSDSPSAGKTWCDDAVKIVEQLFPVSPRESWDALLDLRMALRAGQDWERVLDLFLECRCLLESDNYLPLYRLRQLISQSLRLETVGSEGVHSLRAILRRKHRSLADLRRAVRQPVRIVEEVAAPAKL